MTLVCKWGKITAETLSCLKRKDKKLYFSNQVLQTSGIPEPIFTHLQTEYYACVSLTSQLVACLWCQTVSRKLDTLKANVNKSSLLNRLSVHAEVGNALIVVHGILFNMVFPVL